MKGRVIIIFLFLNAVLSYAQQRVYSFRHYSTADGLTDQHVRCLKFDQQGFLWIGTHGGLHRFDGEHFEVFKKQQNRGVGICGNIISAIEDDGEGGMWIGTSDAGFCHVNREMQMDKQPTLYTRDNIEVTMINDLLLSPRNELLVATGHGLFKADTPYEDFKLVNDSDEKGYYELMLDGSSVYCGQVVGGLIWYEQGEFHNHPVEPKLSPGHTLQTFYKASDGKVYAGGWDDYLHIIHVQEPYQEHISISKQLPEMAGEELVAITEAESGALWLATKSGMIVRYDLAAGIFEKITTSTEERKRLHGSRIYAMTTDQLGRTWIATNAGLHVYNALQSVFDILWLPDNQAVVEDLLADSNELYAATLSGLFIHRNQSWKYVPDMIYSKYRAYMVRKHGKDILVGTHYNLMKLDQERLRNNYPRLPFAVTELISSRVDDISSFQIDGREYFLINIFGYGTAIGEVYGPNWALGMVITGETHENLVNDIFIDRQGQVWFAGTVVPVSRFLQAESIGNPFPFHPWVESGMPEPIHIYSELFQQKDISHHVEDMIQDARGLYWCASQGSGLLKFSPLQSGNFYQEIAGSPLSVRRLALDELDRIWMLSSSGLHCYDPIAEVWKHFTELDGIPTGGLNNGLTIDQDGILYAGGQGFVVSLNTNRNWINNEKPQTKITGFDVNGVHHYTGSISDTLIFSFDQNTIQIHFSSMCFTSPEKYRFEYKLSGANEEWISTGTQNSVTFNQLPPGKYAFFVRAISEDGAVEEASNGVLVWSILPPFYKTWWFAALMLALIVAVIVGFMMYRIQQYKKIAEVRDKLAKDLHDDIGSALGSVSFYSETARLSIDSGNLDQARLVALKMGETSRKMIENIHDIVWAVNPSHDESVHLIERMQTHIADIHSNGGIKIKFMAHPEISGLRLGMKTRKNVYLIFKESIYNAIKYSESAFMEVRLHRSGNRIILEVIDFGKGFELTDASRRGNGLRNMKSRANELSGQLEISSSTQGTKIILTIPIA